MSYRLRRKSLAREVHRIVREELEGALKEVLAVGGDRPSTDVHEARKHLKKTRALVRLLRPGMGKAFYKRENAALRNAAQRMSPIRDAHVRVRTIEKLIARSRTRRPSTAFARVHTAMTAHLRRVLAESHECEWNKHAAAEIESALCRLEKWALKRLTPKSLRNGLKTACKKARLALATARDDPSDANLHELRKGVKDLWYDLRLLRGNQQPPIKALIERTRDLGKKLGDDHDLAMLMAARDDGPAPSAADWQALEKAIALRRPRLQRAAFRLAEKVLAPKSGAFADFVVSQWKTWRSCHR